MVLRAAQVVGGVGLQYMCYVDVAQSRMAVRHFLQLPAFSGILF